MPNITDSTPTTAPARIVLYRSSQRRYAVLVEDFSAARPTPAESLIVLDEDQPGNFDAALARLVRITGFELVTCAP